MRRGISPQRSRGPHRSEPTPPHPPRALPAPQPPTRTGPAASQTLPARVKGRTRKPGPGPPTTRRFLEPKPDVSPAGPPGRAGRFFPLRCSQRLRNLHRLRRHDSLWSQQAEKGVGPRGQGAGGDVTGGGGPGSEPPCRAFPSTSGASPFPAWVWSLGGLCTGVGGQWRFCDRASDCWKGAKTLEVASLLVPQTSAWIPAASERLRLRTKIRKIFIARRGNPFIL